MTDPTLSSNLPSPAAVFVRTNLPRTLGTRDDIEEDGVTLLRILPSRPLRLVL